MNGPIQNNFMSNNFTACIRTQLKILGIGKEARLLQIGNWKKSEFLRLYARYPVTWFSFGNPKFVSWRLRDPMIKDIIYSHFVWKIDLWNHICFSYSETNSYTSFVKVRNNIIKYSCGKKRYTPPNIGTIKVEALWIEMLYLKSTVEPWFSDHKFRDNLDLVTLFGKTKLVF